jgi:two-component system sensor histidine kinase SenX3
MVASLPTIGLILNSEGRVVKASRRAKASGMIRNRRLDDAGIAAMVKRARDERRRVDASITLARPGPAGMPLELDARAVRLGHGYVAILAEDRSRQRRIEAMRRDFLANIGHELKTPIAAVALLAEALQAAAAEPDRVRTFAARLHEESDRLTRLVQEIIELSRLEAMPPQEHAEVCMVDDVIHTAVADLSVATEAGGLHVLVGPACGAWVYGDQRVLVMAVQNLLSNAIRFSPAGESVSVGAVTVDDAVEITVTDHGPGIPAEELPRIFERFYRTDRARSRDTGGTGLGLAIVKHAANTYGGDVRVVSRPAEGSVFTVTLPQADPPSSEAADSREEE